MTPREPTPDPLLDAVKAAMAETAMHTHHFGGVEGTWSIREPLTAEEVAARLRDAGVEMGRPARRADPIDCQHGDWYRDTRDRTWCVDCGRWLDDVVAAAAREPSGSSEEGTDVPRGTTP